MTSHLQATAGFVASLPDTQSSLRLSPGSRLVAATCLGVALLFNVATLGTVPAGIEDDDGAYASAAYTFWRTGKPGVPGYHDVVDLENDVWAFGRLAAVAQGFVMAIAGVSIWNAMLPTFLAGLALVICTGGFARAIAGSDAALLAMAALAMSGKFFLSTHGMRPDTLFAALLMASLWIVAARGPAKPVAALFTAGLITGISSDVHMNGFFLAPIPAAFFLASAEHTRLRTMRGVAVNVVGLGIGFAMWAMIHYVPHPERFLRQLPVMGGSTHGFRLMTLGIAGALIGECQRYIDWFWHARGYRHMPEALCILASAAWVATRADRSLRASLVTWVAIFALSAVFLSNPFGWYLIYVWPLFCIWMAAAFVALRSSPVARILVVALLTVYVTDIALWSYKSVRDVPYSTQTARLRSTIPSDAPVLASGCWWFAFWDRDFTDIAYLAFREAELAREPEALNAIWEREQERRGWKYIVASNRLLKILDPDVTDDAATTGPRIDRTKVLTARRFVRSRAATPTRLQGIQNEALVFNLSEVLSR